MKNICTACLFTFISFSLSISAFASNKPEAHDPWVREAPPNASVMAAYLTLHNHTDKTRMINRASSPDFENVEIHRTEMRDGMAHMMPVSRIMITSQGKVSFAPGSMHIMLINPKRKLRAGDKVQITMHFMDDSTLEISAPVKKSQSMGNSHEHHKPKHNEHNKMNHQNHSEDHSNNQKENHDHNHNNKNH